MKYVQRSLISLVNASKFCSYFLKFQSVYIHIYIYIGYVIFSIPSVSRNLHGIHFMQDLGVGSISRWLIWTFGTKWGGGRKWGLVVLSVQLGLYALHSYTVYFSYLPFGPFLLGSPGEDLNGKWGCLFFWVLLQKTWTGNGDAFSSGFSCRNCSWGNRPFRERPDSPIALFPVSSQSYEFLPSPFPSFKRDKLGRLIVCDVPNFPMSPNSQHNMQQRRRKSFADYTNCMTLQKSL